MDKQDQITREEWLQLAVTEIRQYLTQVASVKVPDVNVSIGWGVSKPKDTRGECWPAGASTDGRNNIFISPRINNVHTILSVLLHECIHAALDCVKPAHGAKFAKVAKDAGLEEPWSTATCGPEAIAFVEQLKDELPSYPLAAIQLGDPKDKKQTTRLVKVWCGDCGYTLRTTAKWLAVGLPTCPCGREMESDVPEGESNG
jgi:hypothetical protein